MDEAEHLLYLLINAKLIQRDADDETELVEASSRHTWTWPPEFSL